MEKQSLLCLVSSRFQRNQARALLFQLSFEHPDLMFHSGRLLDVLRLVEGVPNSPERGLRRHPLKHKARSLGFESLNLRLPPRHSLVLKRQPPHKKLSTAGDSSLAFDRLT